jgi:hypothetical protein
VDRTRTLALSSDKRRRLGQQGQSLYQHQFAWPILAGELLDALDAADRTRNRVFAGTQR